MVQALRELLEDVECNEASIAEALFSFECADIGDDTDDVVNDVITFLRESAIDFEKEGTTRTYLIVNDQQAAAGKLQLDGYFAIAIKTLYFNNVEPDILKELFGDGTKQSCPAFLIGQLARSNYSQKGDGATFLNMALSYIAQASNIVGGRFVYLDCNPERQAYYESHGFTFLRNKPKGKLIQMYRII